MKLSFCVPIRATSSLNARMHWAARAKRVKQERRTVAALMRASDLNRVAAKSAGADVLWRDGHLAITLTRIGPRRMDDDNVQGCLKAVRDEVAAQLGLDDGDARLTWKYEQRKGPYGVEVTIETREAEAA